MEKLNIPPAFIDRRTEIEQIIDFVESIKSGHGKAFFIIGDGGIGKTRIIEETQKYCMNKNVRTLVSRCLPDAPPFAPFVQILKVMGKEHLLATAVPRLDAIYVVNKGGIILFRFERTDKNIDTDIFLGMVTAVENFIKDSMSQIAGESTQENSERMGVMRHGTFTIMNLPSRNLNLVALLEGAENEYLIDDLEKLLDEIEKIVGDITQQKNLDDAEKMATTLMKALIESKKYDGTSHEIGAEIKKTGIFENVVRGLKRYAAEAPAILIIDDLQWADTSTLSLLNYILRDIAEVPLGLICTVRKEDIGKESAQALSKLMQAMKEDNLIETIHLGALSPEATGELIEHVLGGYIGASFKEKIYQETEGNPMFVIEILKYLYDKGLLTNEGTVWLYNEREIKIPERMYEIIKDRISRLTEDEFELVEIASVVGLQFTSTILEKIADMDKIKLLKILSRIEKNHGLIKHEQNAYRFELSKIRDVIYEEMNLELRKMYHEKLGNILEEEVKKGDESKLVEMTYHYIKSETLDKINEYGLDAAQKLAEKFAYDEAIEILFMMYKNLNSRIDDERKKLLRVCDKIIDLMIICGRFRDVVEIIEQKIKLLGEDALEKGKAYTQLAEVSLKMGSADDALRYISIAFDTIAKAGANNASDAMAKDIALARALSMEGYIHERCARYEHAIKSQEQALAKFIKHGIEHDTAHVYNRLGAIYYYTGDYAKSAEYLKKGEQIMQKIGDLYGLSLVYNNLGMVDYELENFERAMEWQKKSMEIKEKIHDLAGMAITMNNIGNIYFELGQLEKAIACYIETKNLCVKTGDKWMYVYNMVDLAETYYTQGDMEKYKQAIEDALTVARKIGIEKEVLDAKKDLEGAQD